MKRFREWDNGKIDRQSEYVCINKQLDYFVILCSAWFWFHTRNSGSYLSRGEQAERNKREVFVGCLLATFFSIKIRIVMISNQYVATRLVFFSQHLVVRQWLRRWARWWVCMQRAGGGGWGALGKERVFYQRCEKVFL